MVYTHVYLISEGYVDGHFYTKVGTFLRDGIQYDRIRCSNKSCPAKGATPHFNSLVLAPDKVPEATLVLQHNHLPPNPSDSTLCRDVQKTIQEAIAAGLDNEQVVHFIVLQTIALTKAEKTYTS